MSSTFYKADQQGNFQRFVNEAYEQMRRDREEQARYEHQRAKAAQERMDEEYKQQRDRARFFSWGNAFTRDNPGSSEITTDAVKTLFRKLSKKYHPDIGGSNEAMKALGEFRDEVVKIIEGSS